jgi:hypothetical protein
MKERWFSREPTLQRVLSETILKSGAAFFYLLLAARQQKIEQA